MPGAATIGNQQIPDLRWRRRAHPVQEKPEYLIHGMGSEGRAGIEITDDGQDCNGMVGFST